ncbi:MAG: helix-turn-helix transcriptional regulator [Prevotella sp.]|nr:helix-turn-helix transcriptional regulator [Prevotella sp.]MBQ6210319.1 helix-turn-helix transcriptional regulator [Prevotella sp.]
MKDRIKALMESQHMTQQTFSQFIQVSPATLSSIFNGRTRPTLNMVEAIKNKIPNLSMEWLMFGKDPMYLDAPPASEQPKEPSTADTTQQFLEFDAPTTPQKSKQEATFQPSVSNTPIKQPETIVKYLDKPQRQITEIRIFYDDQTWETFVPKK